MTSGARSGRPTRCPGRPVSSAQRTLPRGLSGCVPGRGCAHPPGAGGGPGQPTINGHVGWLASATLREAAACIVEYPDRASDTTVGGAPMSDQIPPYGQDPLRAAPPADPYV